MSCMLILQKFFAKFMIVTVFITGDIKKLISWYNILVNNGITEFVEAPADSADKVEEAVAE